MSLKYEPSSAAFIDMDQMGAHITSSSSSVLLSSLQLSDTQVYEPQIQALLGTASHFCEVFVLKLRTVPIGTAPSLRILRVIRRGSQAMYKRGAVSRLVFKAHRLVYHCRGGLVFKAHRLVNHSSPPRAAFIDMDQLGAHITSSYLDSDDDALEEVQGYLAQKKQPPLGLIRNSHPP